VTNEIEALLDEADLLLEQGRLKEAEHVYSRICTIEPLTADAWLMLGMIYGDTGNAGEAIRHLKRCLEIAPSTYDAHYALGSIYLIQNKLDDAYVHAVEATLDEPYTEAWLLRSAVSARLGKYDESESCAFTVTQQSPQDPEGYINLAHAQSQQHNFSDAKIALDTALRFNPDRADAIHLYAYVCEQLGRDKEAAAFYDRLSAMQGMQHIGHLALSKLYAKNGNSADALEHAQNALKCKPDFAEAVSHCAHLHHFLGNHEVALPLYEQASRLTPQDYLVQERYADACRELGWLEVARDLYSKCLNNGGSVSARVKQATALPVIAESVEQISVVREALLKSLNDLENQRLHIDNPAETIGSIPFYTVYHGLNDLQINRALADFYIQASPSLSYTAKHVGTVRNEKNRIKIGFISRFFCTHTIGQVMRDIIKDLSRDQFEVILFSFPYRNDAVATEINASADRCVFLPSKWNLAHELIAGEQLDILFYTDIGMEPYTYFLAYSRLAPIQCTTWGHAVTTGIPNIDYYLSCDTFEPAGAESHYSETLVRLSSAPTHYPKPYLAGADSTRSDLGWNGHKNIYLCPQVLFKVHPEMDDLLAGILREDGNGEIVLLECRHQSWKDLLMRRFGRTIPDVVKRIKVLPYPGPAGYLRMLRACDVMLDTYHYGGGSTSLQGLGLGTPIVTLPGAFQRGRHTYAYYQAMGLTDCIAKDKDDYIGLALNLGRDRGYRAHVSDQIKEKNNVLFYNKGVIEEMERFFRDCFPVKW